MASRCCQRVASSLITILRKLARTWSGIGGIAVGMARQGYDLQLTRYTDQGWRANFYPAGIAHSVVSGSGWALGPWEAVQRAAWVAFAQRDGAQLDAGR